MHYATPVLAALAVACMTSLSSAAFAHGESGHGKPKAFDASRVEEKPFGRAGDPKRVKRTVGIAMTDSMHFYATAAAPSERAGDAPMSEAAHPGMAGDITVKRGETVRFRVRNQGRVMHEMVIGTLDILKDHAEVMRRFPNMEHDEPYMAHVPPGKEGEIVWQFTQAGEFHYACLIPGHMEAGMIAKITVK